MDLSKTMECVTPRVNSIKLWTLDDYDISVGSLTVTNVPLWWGILMMGKAMHMLRQRAYREPLYPSPLSSSFSANLQML